jgi:hypothetical protein
MVRRVFALPVVAAALVAAACGGAKHYALEPTRACLGKISGATVRPPPPSDFVAATAIDGAVNVKLSKNQVTLTFSQDSHQADGIAKAYRRFKGKGIGIESALEEIANVVLVWGVTPEDPDRGVVHDCLKS